MHQSIAADQSSVYLSPVIVRQCGLQDPDDWGPDCEDELRRMTALWNKLVEINQDHVEHYRAATADDPAVKEKRERYEYLKARISSFYEEIRALKQQKGSPKGRKDRLIDIDAIDARIALLKSEIADLKPQQKEAAASLKEAVAGAREAIKPRLKALSQEHKETAATARHPQQSGLYWGNYNAICAAFDDARQKTMAAGGEIRFRRHDGSGRLVNQIQGGMTVEELFAGSRSQVRVTPRTVGDRGTRGRKNESIGGKAKWSLTITVYRRDRTETGNRTVTWPMSMHRPIPPEYDIKEVVVHRRRIEARFVWSVTFTCTLRVDTATDAAVAAWQRTYDGIQQAIAAALKERKSAEKRGDAVDAITAIDARIATLKTERKEAAAALMKAEAAARKILLPKPAPATGDVIAIDLGWRKQDDGLRVATIMRKGNSPPEFVMLPRVLVDRLERSDRIKGHRDELLNALDPRALVGRILRDDSPPEVAAHAEKLKQAPKISAARLATTAREWRAYKDFQPDDFAAIEAWRIRDKHLWCFEANGRDQAQRWRLDHYRNEARKIVDSASVIILEKFDLSQAARVKDVDNPLWQAARHQRVLAALHILRTWIVQYAKKRGTHIHWHEGVSTWQCSACGHRINPRAPELLRQQCPHCSAHVFDQDVEACRNMLAAWDARAAVAE